MEGTVSGAVLVMTSEVCVCVSLVPRCSNIQEECLISTLHTCVRIFKNVSVNAFVNYLSHMAGSSIWSEFLGLKWLSKQSRI